MKYLTILLQDLNVPRTVNIPTDVPDTVLKRAPAKAPVDSSANEIAEREAAEKMQEKILQANNLVKTNNGGDLPVSDKKEVRVHRVALDTRPNETVEKAAKAAVQEEAQIRDNVVS